MQLAMIGLGKMGGNMTERLIRGGHSVVAFDRDAAVVSKYQGIGASPAKDLADIVAQLAAPRVVWIMVPAGKPTDDTIDALSALLSQGDIIIDGGNSNFKDSKARAERLSGKGMHSSMRARAAGSGG
jgi:6-phosphogluconate dehydrogenase